MILQVPECDLPKRFLPSTNSSDPFVKAVHSGMDDLKRRWIEEKAVKECGWPAHVVKEHMLHDHLAEHWGRLVFALNCGLVGTDYENAIAIEPGDSDVIDGDEVEALGGQMGSNEELVIPLPVAPLFLHIITPDDHKVPASGTHPPMYLTSTSVAAYVRLHILSKLILAFNTGTLRESTESVIMAAMHLIEEEWATIEDDGPPSISEVLQHLLPRKGSPSYELPQYAGSADTHISTRTRKPRTPRQDDRTDALVKEHFEQLARRSEYSKMLASREKLPAFTARNQFLELLRRNRCVIVVGETGECECVVSIPYI